MRCALIITILSLCLTNLKGQHTVDFSSKTQVCQGELLKFVNTSEAAAQTKWSFCTDQLDRTYSSSSAGSIVGNMTDLAIVEDNGQWYGFATSRNNVLLRLNFGDNPNNSYTTTIITDTNGLLQSPEGISIIKEGNNWVGLITLINNEIIRANWGSSLAVMPQLQSLGLNSTGKLSNPIQIKIEYDQGNYVALIANPTGNFITSINFGSSLSNVVTGANMLVSPAFPSAVDLYGVTVSNHCGQWTLYALAQNHIYRVDVGQSLFSAITVGQITDFSSGIPISIGDFNKIHSIDVGKYTYVYFISYTGQYVAAVKWQEGNSTPQFLSLGNPTVPSNPYSFDIFNYNGKYGLYVAGFGGGVNLVSTDGICQSSVVSSSDVNPIGIFYNQPGTYTINLEETYADGQTCSQSKQIIVTSDIAPKPLISNDNICVSSTVSFNAASQNTISISSWNWDFGSSTSTSESPTHVFNTAGLYTVNLEVTSANGCLNTTSKALKIYDQPNPLFSLPSGLICTNNEFIFTNNTIDNYDGNLSYQWRVANNLIATTKDLRYTFASGGNQDIKLLASIPGCTNEITQTLNNVQAGPVVGFSQSGQCEANQVTFTNASSGSISGYVWNFGNGNTSTDVNPVQTYQTKGTYAVSLQTTGTNGCISSTSKSLTIYSKPQPDFSLELPPFSCSATPSQFTNTTPSPTDSNIASWAWQFGDDANGTSTSKDPLYTFSKSGNYNVSLTARTNFGCSSVTTKAIAIAQGPTVAFNNVPACANQGTRFSDASGNDIKSWLWKIGNSTYAFSNPTHVFTTPGSYNVQLTVTGNNNCIATLSKTITVPASPTLDFSFTNACEGQSTTFQDVSPLASDPVASQSWDFAGNAKSGSPIQYSFDIAGTYAVKMTSTQQSGCVYSVSKNVVINPTPVAKFSATPEWGVPPLSVQFTNQSTGASTYLWRFNDKNASTSTETSPAFMFTDLGDYVVDLVATSSQGCSNTTSSKISVIIPSLDLELKELNLVKDPTSGSYRIMVTIKNRSNFVLTSADVIVDISGYARIKETIATTILPDGEVSQLLTNQVIPGSLFTYLCAELDVTNDIDSFNNKMCESVSSDGVIFSPYPNPSNGEFRFEWISNSASDAHFIITNSMGQLVFKQDVTVTSSGLNQAYFDLRSYNEGMYFFKFSTNSDSKTIPIVIAR